MKFSFLVLGLAVLTIQAANAKNIRVMSYNVENLFDTVHDDKKDDWTFVPAANPDKQSHCEEVTVDYYKKTCLETDWTPNKLEIKLSQIDKVVKSLGVLPDVLALIEVENASVVDKLRAKIGYKNFIITNSPDIRGVDVALLYNESSDLKFVDAKEHKLRTSRYGITSATRNILEANFKANGKPVSIYVNHWPSQQSGPNSRASAATQILEILKPKLADANSKIMLIGDFNVTDIETPNPMTDVLTNNTGLIDIYTKLSKTDKAKLAPGTYFYGWDFSWNRLDRVIVNNGFLKGSPSVNPKSYVIYAPAMVTRVFEQKNPERPRFGEKMISPWGYWHNAYTQDRAGFSDHYPILVDITL